MKAQAPQTLDQIQFHTAAKAASERFAQLRKKHPTLKGYLVLSIPGKQTAIGSSLSEILGNLPSLIVDDAAKAAFTTFLTKPLPKDASESHKEQVKEQLEQLALDLKYDGSTRVEIRFANLSYELIWQLQSDELVDRELTPQTRASSRIVLGTLAAFAL